MEFGLDRCAKIVLKKGKVVHTQNLILNINPLNAELNPIRHLLALVGARHIVHVGRIRVNREVEQPEQGKTFRYEGFEENEGIRHQHMINVEEGIHQEIKNGSKSRVEYQEQNYKRLILLAPILRYSFGIVNWRSE